MPAVHGQAGDVLSSEMFKIFANFIVILTALFVVNVGTLMLVSDTYNDENSLLPLQSFETQVVYHIQKGLGYNVELEHSDEKVLTHLRVIVEYDGDSVTTLNYNALTFTFQGSIDRNITVTSHRLTVDAAKNDSRNGTLTVIVMKGDTVIRNASTSEHLGSVGLEVPVENRRPLDMPTVLYYPDMVGEDGKPAPAIEITGICAGLREMAVIATLVLLVGGVRWGVKVKWALILSGIVFLENLLRIFLIHPLAMEYGWDFAWYQFHQFFWEYGQLISIMVFFLIWYSLVVMRDPVRTGWSEMSIRYPKRPLSPWKFLPIPRRS